MSGRGVVRLGTWEFRLWKYVAVAGARRHVRVAGKEADA